MSKYLVVRPNDLVFNKLRTWQGGFGVSRHEGVVSPAYFVCRPSHAVEPRYLHHLLRSEPYLAELTRVSKFMPPSQFDILWDDLRLLPILLPPRMVQREIADYLDTETARIDALIRKKQTLLALLDERLRASADEVLRAASYVHLRRVADLLPGYTFPSEWFGPDNLGPLLLRGVNVGVGEIRWDDAVRLRGDGLGLHRYRLETGDLVLGMDRPFIGSGTRVAEVDPDSAGSLLVQRVCRIRIEHGALATVVRHVLRSRRFMAHVEPDLSGVSVPHLSEAQIGSMPVPVMTKPGYEAAARKLGAAEDHIHRLATRLRKQLNLLTEHRQALITAAVAGELPVSEVAA